MYQYIFLGKTCLTLSSVWRLTQDGECVHEEKLDSVDVDDPRDGREYDRHHPAHVHLTVSSGKAVRCARDDETHA